MPVDPLLAKTPGQLGLAIDHSIDQQHHRIGTFRWGMAVRSGHGLGVQESLRSSRGRIARNNPLARAASNPRQAVVVRSP